MSINTLPFCVKKKKRSMLMERTQHDKQMTSLTFIFSHLLYIFERNDVFYSFDDRKIHEESNLNYKYIHTL